MHTKTASAIILTLACALGGCSSSGDGTTSEAPAAAATSTAAPAEATTPSPTTTATATTATTALATTAKATTAPRKTKAPVKVPDGVGLNYQSAQDLWRAAGLHVAPATDATGAHRLPLIDANWVVVAQDLKAGSKVAADSFITATVKKYSDD
ncbi:PASTA domain-containing protein [Symbioplanes lichenis]|uniref:PASTA domain-containing protein n=1 Tax=Symbioplanes lichenis TaxID=1629072 RepID=UPI0027393767|nr:PASTA domain-containing protein [Actinoplanes lichenis]